LEYWDIERRRYPQYDHCAVLVAEDITSRFLNVIGLFNSSVPIISIQMTALGVGDQVALVFHTVLDELTRGLEEEEEDAQEATDRAYWEARAARDTMAMADRLASLVRQFDPKLELKYNKFYIGLARDGAPDNFVSFKPQKSILRLEARLARSEDLDTQLEEAGLDVMPYSPRWRKYRIRLTKADLDKHEALIGTLVKRAYEERNS
jgi:predicted transport protein